MAFYLNEIKKYIPAMQPVIKQATFPAIIALRTMAAKSGFLCGAMAPKAPNIIPMEPRFENPHNAYVAITSERSCKGTNVFS